MSVYKFGRSHVPGYDSTTVSPEGETDEGPTEPHDAADTAPAEEPRETDTDSATGQTGRSDPSDAADAEVSDTSNGKPAGPDSRGGSYNEGRAVARQNALAEQLKESLKGKLEPPDEDDDTVEPTTTGGNSGGALGDEEYREAAARYEWEANREPEFGDPYQVGWDIRSVDPENNEVRLIEVKGKGCLWDGDEVVELSRAQVRESFKAADRQNSGVLVFVRRREDARKHFPRATHQKSRPSRHQMDAQWQDLAHGCGGSTGAQRRVKQPESMMSSVTLESPAVSQVRYHTLPKNTRCAVRSTHAGDDLVNVQPHVRPVLGH